MAKIPREALGKRIEKAPETCIRRLFDHYAPHFDASLAQLQYRAPALIAERLAGMVAADGCLAILDAGCGTGLCAPLLKPFAARLVGVDLSAGMLKEAAKRGLYDELVEGELTGYMAAHWSAFDVIVVCDTLVYQVGSTISSRRPSRSSPAAISSSPWSICLMTAAITRTGWRRPGGFATAPPSLQATLAAAGLVDASANAIVPRLECGQPVDGLLVTALTPAHTS